MGLKPILKWHLSIATLYSANNANEMLAIHFLRPSPLLPDLDEKKHATRKN